MDIRQMLIQHRDYKALRNNAPLYHIHVIEQLLVPLRRQLGRWKDSACRICLRSYETWIERFEGMFDRMINGQVPEISRNYLLLVDIEDFQTRLTEFEQEF